VPRAGLGVTLPPCPVPAHKPANRRLIIWSAALFSMLSVLGALAFYLTASESVPVTAGSTGGIMPLAVPPAGRSNGAIMPLVVPPSARANAESNAIDIGRPATDALAGIQSFLPVEKGIERSRAGLIERVRTVKFAAGDIETARAALNRLVEGGNAWAAVDLGSTYDPIILEALGVRNFPPDVAKARTWYQMAQQMGSPEAVELLESLDRSTRRSR
jgi:TPR repeat protein